MPTALYARYSTDKQSESSIPDQFAAGRVKSVELGWHVAHEFSDAETSGSIPFILRSGGGTLMAAAKEGRFDCLILESLSRLSRDPVDQEHTIRRLEYLGIRIITILDGYDSQNQFREDQRWLNGFANRAQLRQLAQATRRGLAGQVERGYHPGGKPYGYRSIQEAHGHRLQIEPEQARWVRWIFERYVEGQSTQQIAYALNAHGIKSPGGGTWAVSALYGSPNKGCGILNNTLYIGRQTWNRSTWIKDPDTGKRKRVENPESEWKTTDRPELRILDQGLWDAARIRMDTPQTHGGSKGRGKTPTSLLGGILVCGHCGGAVVAVNRMMYGCAARKDRGPTVCLGIYAKRRIAEERILATLKDELLSPLALAELHRQMRELQAGQAQTDTRPALAEIERQIKNLVEAITMAGISPELAAKLKEKQAEKARLKAAQAAASAPMLAADELIARYRTLVGNLPAAVEHDKARARTILRELLGEIRLEVEDGATCAYVETTAQRLMMAAGQSLKVVAGTGFEPMTFGL